MAVRWLAGLLVVALVTACGGPSAPGPTPTQRAATADTAPASASETAAPSTATLAPETTATQPPATLAPEMTATQQPPAASVPPETAPATETAVPAAIEIEGTPDFIDWTEQALELLQTAAPQWYEQVTASIRTIRSVPAGSGMDVFDKVYLVGEITAYAPGFAPAQQLIWYAGTIVHDSCHSERYDEGLVYLGKEGEVACLMDQKAALLLLDTDPYFSDYVQGLIDGADDPANAYWTNPDRHW